MKNSKIAAYLTGMALVGLGIAMAVTNPNQQAYEQYATRQLTDYLEKEQCPKADNTVQQLCQFLREKSVQQQIRQAIANNTEHQNFLVLSIYKTNLSVDRLLPNGISQFLPSILGNTLPSYHFETLGVFSNFRIFKAEEQ